VGFRLSGQNQFGCGGWTFVDVRSNMLVRWLGSWPGAGFKGAGKEGFFELLTPRGAVIPPAPRPHHAVFGGVLSRADWYSQSACSAPDFLPPENSGPRSAAVSALGGGWCVLFIQPFEKLNHGTNQGRPGAGGPGKRGYQPYFAEGRISAGPGPGGPGEKGSSSFPAHPKRGFKGFLRVFPAPTTPWPCTVGRGPALSNISGLQNLARKLKKNGGLAFAGGFGAKSQPYVGSCWRGSRLPAVGRKLPPRQPCGGLPASEERFFGTRNKPHREGWAGGATREKRRLVLCFPGAPARPTPRGSSYQNPIPEFPNPPGTGLNSRPGRAEIPVCSILVFFFLLRGRGAAPRGPPPPGPFSLVEEFSGPPLHWGVSTNPRKTLANCGPPKFRTRKSCLVGGG